MEDSYLTGMGIAFLIGLAKIAIAVSLIFSQRASNLKKIGLHYSLMKGAFVSETPVTFFRFCFFAFYLLVFAPIFSWLSVLSAAWVLVAQLSNRTAVPDKVKEIQYKIAHASLSKEQMISLQEEIAKTLNLPTQIRTGDPTEDSESDPNTLVLDPGEWYQEVRLDSRQKTLTFYGHTPDYDSIFNSIFEYRFVAEKLECRLLEEHIDHYGKEDWYVRDNVILESEIRKRDQEKTIKLHTVEEDLEKYKAQIVWHPFERYDVRFFAMGKHPELFPRAELRRLIRSDLERLRLGKENVLKRASELGIETSESETGFEFQLPENFPEERKAEVREAFSNKSLKQFSITTGELSVFRTYENDLLRLLGEKPTSPSKAKAS